MPCPAQMLGAIPPTRLAVVGAVIPSGGPPCMHDYLFAVHVVLRLVVLLP